MTTRPAWATRLRREREARGWSQSQAVANLRAIYQRANGKEGGSQESLTRQWKEWESGRVRPREWARYIAAAFGTVADDLFPVDRVGALSLETTGMDTAELMARLQRSSIDTSTIRAIELTVERLSAEYRFKPTAELRSESHEWLRQMTRLLDQRLTYAQHGEILSLAGRLALLVGCIEYDAGDHRSAEATRRYALDLGTELDNRDIMGWAHEMSAWFALTNGDYHRAIAVSEHGIEVAGPRGVSVQLHAQIAKAWARLGNAQQVEVTLDRGRSCLENLARPTNPDDHFAIDAAKWHFYAMDAYRNIGKDAIARLYAEEVIRLGTTGNGELRSPMRVAEARVTLGVIAARGGDVEDAVKEGTRALDSARQSLPSLVMVGQELNREFHRQKLDVDARVIEFRAQLEQTAAVLRVGGAGV